MASTPSSLEHTLLSHHIHLQNNSLGRTLVLHVFPHSFLLYLDSQQPWKKPVVQLSARDLPPPIENPQYN